MDKPILLRDVMNSKSDKHFRHSENAYDIQRLSFYYAIESRIFNGVWNEELEKYTRGPLWFTNLMVFDFDFDEKHYPNIKNYESKLNDSLNKLEQILGKPKFKIFNKQYFSNWEKEVYFTKNGEINLPKKCGCQVVYELKESLQSQYKEKVNLYNSIRLHISSLVDADMNFKGHMFKNPYNKKLFSILENKNYDTVDIFDLALKFNYENVEKIKNLKPFESLKSKNELPSYLKKYNNMLLGFYQELNTWKSNNYKVNYKNKMFYIENCKKSDSRNETLFEYFKNIPLSNLKNVEYLDLINSNLFDNCSIKEAMEEEEFENTKQSVLLYREKNNIEYVDKNIDNRVFKFEQKSLNMNFFDENKNELLNSISKISNKEIIVNWTSFNIPIKLYKNNSFENLLSNLFLCFGAENILTNIRNLLTPQMLDFYKDFLSNSNIGNCTMDIKNIGMWDLFCIVKNAIYLTHFKYYKSIQNFRHAKPVKQMTKLEKRNILFKEWGIDFNGDILGFKNFYLKLKENKLLKDDGKPLPISFYQNYFHIKNIYASIFVKLINKYLKISKLIQTIIEIKKHNIKLIDVKHILIFKNNTSQQYNYLIKIFNINYYLFNIMDNKLNYKFSNKYIIYQTYDNECIKYLFKKFKKYIYLKKGNINMNILLFDLETTGLNPRKSFILSNGAILYNTETKEVKEFYELINWKNILSNFYIPEDTIKVHKITEEFMEKEGLSPLQSMSNFYNFIKNFIKDDVLDACVAFNLPYDLNMFISNIKYLKQYCENFDILDDDYSNICNLLNLFSKSENSENNTLFIDSLIIDQIFHFEVDGEKVRHDLDSVGQRYGLLSDPNAHNAIADTRRMFEVFKVQLNEIKEKNIELNTEFENRLFKKYKRNQDLWKKKDSLDYFGQDMVAALF